MRNRRHFQSMIALLCGAMLLCNCNQRNITAMTTSGYGAIIEERSSKPKPSGFFSCCSTSVLDTVVDTANPTHVKQHDAKSPTTPATTTGDFFSEQEIPTQSSNGSVAPNEAIEGAEEKTPQKNRPSTPTESVASASVNTNTAAGSLPYVGQHAEKSSIEADSSEKEIKIQWTSVADEAIEASVAPQENSPSILTRQEQKGEVEGVNTTTPSSNKNNKNACSIPFNIRVIKKGSIKSTQTSKDRGRKGSSTRSAPVRGSVMRHRGVNNTTEEEDLSDRGCDSSIDSTTSFTHSTKSKSKFFFNGIRQAMCGGSIEANSFTKTSVCSVPVQRHAIASQNQSVSSTGAQSVPATLRQAYDTPQRRHQPHITAASTKSAPVGGYTTVVQQQSKQGQSTKSTPVGGNEPDEDFLFALTTRAASSTPNKLQPDTPLHDTFDASEDGSDGAMDALWGYAEGATEESRRQEENSDANTSSGDEEEKQEIE